MQKPSQPSCCFCDTAFGPVAVLWSVHRGLAKILRIVLPGPGRSVKELVQTAFPDALSASCAEMDAVADRIVAFLAGENTQFALDIVRLDRCSGFGRKVLRAVHGIPRGRARSYQQIAARVGAPAAARAVGTVMASHPFPIIIPCHRVIRSDGTLGGYQPGDKMKRTLLEMEGFTQFIPSRKETRESRSV